jgi:mannonate dehydratase
MNRRAFVSSSGAAALTLGSSLAPKAASAAPAPKAMMKLGCQSAPTNEAHLKYFARYGVRNICGYPTIAEGRLYATVDELKTMRDLADANGISIDCLSPPFLASSHIDREKHPAIMLAQSPERDRDIEGMQTMIRNCAAAGIPSIKYNMSILGVIRTGRSPGRGDSSYSTWSLKNAHPEPALTRAGNVTADMAWERITYFLERIIPVAAEYKVRMALPPTRSRRSPEGFQTSRVLCWWMDFAPRVIKVRPVPWTQFLPGHGI